MKGKSNNFKYSGFTLIELLAVIVILAIIALIATPIILGIVEDARKDSFMRSVELVVGTTDIDIFSKDFSDSYTYTITDGVVSNLDVGVKNTDGMNGKIKYDKNGNDTYAIHNGKYCVIKTKGMKKAEITDYVEGECVLGKATDVKYFTYEEISENEYEYEIVDKDACVDWFENDGSTNEEAISMCNNEPQEWWDEMILTEWLASGYAPQEAIDELKEVGAIEEKVTLLFEGIEITGYSSEGPKDIIIPEEINGKEVVSIGSFAFSNMSLTSVVLPETLVKISHSAFSTNLFTDITLPSNVETIEDYAFCYTNLNQTSIDNIEEINANAYCTVTDENCFTYQDATITTGYEIVDKDACVEFHITEWDYDEEYAISMCNNEPVDGVTLTEYLATEASQSEINDLKEAGAIEEIVTSLDGIEITGYQCSATDIVIPNEINDKKVVSIGVETFLSYRYNNGITYLNKGMIMPVNSSIPPEGIITSVAIPDSVEYIETDAFCNNKISRLKLSSNLSQIFAYAFDSNELTQTIIPDSVTNIGTEAFSRNEIYILKLSSNLLNISSNAFAWNNLMQLNIPDSVTSIGHNAFWDNHLTSITISDNNQLEVVGDDAFSCMSIPENSKGYQIIYDINPDAIAVECGGAPV